MVATDAINKIKTIIEKHGTTVTVYSPTKTLNDEGDETLSLGSGTSVKCAIFDIGPEEMQWKVEGLDLADSYRCYFSPSVSIDKDTIVKFNGKYYKIHSLGKAVVEGQTVYYQAVITKAELNI